MVSRRQFLRALGACGTAGLIVPEFMQQAVRASATLLWYPYLQDVRSDRAKVMWTTLEGGVGMILYSNDGSNYLVSRASRKLFPPLETRLPEPFYQHRADLTELSPGSEYQCQALLDGLTLPLSVPVSIRPPGPGPFQFLALGDSGLATGAQRQIAQLMNREPAALVVHTGDIAYMLGSYQEFQDRHFRYYWEMMCRVPFYPSPGNHEYYTDNAAPYLAVHSVPTEGVPAEDHGRYYSFDWGNAHFIALDSNLPLVKAAQGPAVGKMLEWLESDLEQSKKFWRIPFFHHAPYATGNNVRDPLSVLAREFIVPIFDRHQVELVLNGHEHSYQRSWPIRNNRIVEPEKGTMYVTTGGGGADLYAVPPGPFLAAGESVHHYVRGEVNGYRLTLDAIRSNGSRIETIQLAPPPSISSVHQLRAGAAELLPFTKITGAVSIAGRHLAAEESRVASLPLPATLSNIRVDVGGRPLGLIAVSSMQIVAELPAGLSGETRLRVTTPNGSAETSIWIFNKGGNRRR